MVLIFDLLTWSTVWPLDGNTSTNLNSCHTWQCTSDLQVIQHCSLPQKTGNGRHESSPRFRFCSIPMETIQVHIAKVSLQKQIIPSLWPI